MPNPSSSSRSKQAAGLSGQPPQTRAAGARAQHSAALSGPRPQPAASSRAKAAAGGRNPALENLGKQRTIPGRIMGVNELLGQILQTADGRSFRITGMEVVLPDTAETHAMQKKYGVAAADATRVARGPERVVGPPQPLPWDRPAYLTTFMRPTGTPAPTLVGPVQPARPLTATEKYVGLPLDVGGKHYGGATSLLDANALTHASKTRINNALFQSVQKFNRMAGDKVLAPSRVASRGVRLLNATQGAAKFSSKFGTKLGYGGMGLAAAKITYEASTDKWNAHTFVDGGMLLVTVAGVVATILAGGTAPIWVPIAGAVILIYGLADYAFDLGGQLDQSVGRHTALWK